MVHGLAGVGAAVADDAEAAGQSLLRGDLRADREAVARQRGVVVIYFRDGSDVLLRDDQDVRRRLGIDVPEGVAEFVLIDLCAGDLTGNDGAEQAVVFHRYVLLT